MEDNEKQFTKAFNNGYLLSKHEPELLDKILRSPDAANNAYIKAMALGKEQYEQDKVIEKEPAKDRYPSWLTGERFKTKNAPEPDKDKDMDKEMDKDVEPEPEV